MIFAIDAMGGDNAPEHPYWAHWPLLNGLGRM